MTFSLTVDFFKGGVGLCRYAILINYYSLHN